MLIIIITLLVRFGALMPEMPTIEGILPSAGPIAQLIEMGGPVMIVLMVMAVAGMITFFYLMLSGTLFAPRYTRRLRRAVDRWKQAPGQNVAESLAKDIRGLARLNPLNHLVLMTMNARLRGEPAEQVRDSVSGRAQQALIPFEAPLKIIEVIAALAPLLGLLGTVMGMMEAFGTMAAAEGRASASQLSGGIYQALTTTAAGLILAIPFAALAAWIEFRLRRLQGTLNTALAAVNAVR
jgi:biopolymer transport protein ExbB